MLNAKHTSNLCDNVCRWNPRKRMTPEEALRHEWILSGTRQKSPSNGESLRHSQSEASVNQESSSYSSSGASSSYSRQHYKCVVVKSDKLLKAKIVDSSKLNDSTSVDSNLNDSGTFLPPIL